MPKLHNIINHQLCLVFFFAVTVSSSGHDDDDVEWKTYPLKDRIHHLCSGHGAMHRTEDELGELFNRFAEHYQEIISLVGEANEDNYLVQLTHFVEKSNLTTKQKNSVYRDIYEKVNIQLGNGDEWNRTLRKLVSVANILNEEELKNHLDSKDPALVSRIQKKLSQIQRAGNQREQFSRSETGINEGSLTNNLQVRRGISESEQNPSRLPWIIAGVVVLGSLALLFKTFKGKSTS